MTLLRRGRTSLTLRRRRPYGQHAPGGVSGVSPPHLAPSRARAVRVAGPSRRLPLSRLPPGCRPLRASPLFLVYVVVVGRERERGRGGTEAPTGDEGAAAGERRAAAAGSREPVERGGAANRRCWPGAAPQAQLLSWCRRSSRRPAPGSRQHAPRGSPAGTATRGAAPGSQKGCRSPRAWPVRSASCQALPVAERWPGRASLTTGARTAPRLAPGPRLAPAPVAGGDLPARAPLLGPTGLAPYPLSAGPGPVSVTARRMANARAARAVGTRAGVACWR
jgi:hypothetical protein